MSEIKENRVIPLAKLTPHPRNYRQHPPARWEKHTGEQATLLERVEEAAHA